MNIVILGYVHTVPDRFLLRFKSCSGTVWTGINVLLWCRNCSEAFPVWTEALSVTQIATLPFDLKRLFSKTRFRCNFCSDKSVYTWFGPFQKPIRYGTFHFQQRSGAVLFRSRNCFESSVPSVNRSPVRYTFCVTPFHYPVHCEHSLSILFHQLSRLCNAWSQHAPPCFWIHCKGVKDFKEVSLHAPITWNTFQFKQKNMTNVACFYGQHFLCLKGINVKYQSLCLPLQLLWKEVLPWEGNQRTKENQYMI